MDHEPTRAADGDVGQAALPPPSAQRGRLARWERLTLALLVLGYSGYYLCRSHFSVSKPALIEELTAAGVPDAKTALGAVASWGTLAYAAGKFVGGGLADSWGGRRNFLVGMAGAVLCTILFALGGGLPLFTLAWVGNRAVQALGWPGMVRITSRWFSFSRYGTVMGIISLSYLFGDAASRAFMGALFKGGMGWRGVFFTAAAVLAALLVAASFLLRESPGQVGLPEPESDPTNLYAGEEKPAVKGDGKLSALLRPLLRSPAFWYVCVLSFGFTIVREAFNEWTPTYFTEGVKLDKGAAAGYSALFPLFGGVSVLIAGALGDRLGRAGRAGILLGGLVLSAVALSALGRATAAGPAVAVALVALTGFLLIGPYSYLAGAVALDFGGKRGSATACGIIDGVGYLGGILAGRYMAELSVAYGWGGAFLALAGIAAASALVAVPYLLTQRGKKVARESHGSL